MRFVLSILYKRTHHSEAIFFPIELVAKNYEDAEAFGKSLQDALIFDGLVDAQVNTSPHMDDLQFDTFEQFFPKVFENDISGIRFFKVSNEDDSLRTILLEIKDEGKTKLANLSSKDKNPLLETHGVISQKVRGIFD